MNCTICKLENTLIELKKHPGLVSIANVNRVMKIYLQERDSVNKCPRCEQHKISREVFSAEERISSSTHRFEY